MQLQRYMLSINNILLVLFLFLSKTTQAITVGGVELFVIEYGSGGTVTLSKGADYDSNASYTTNMEYCASVNKATLSISILNSSAAITGTKTEVATTNGNSSNNCHLAVGALLPVTFSYQGTFKSVCISGGTLLDHFKHVINCYDDSIASSVKDATCTISSGDITHDYGTILSDEVEGKSVTTKATVSCTGGSSYGTVNIALSLSDEKVNLKDDDSLYARLDLNGNGTTTTASVDINSSTTLNVTSTLYTNGNVSSGAFSGSSVLTMTYY